MPSNRQFKIVDEQGGSGGWPRAVSDPPRPKLHRELQRYRLTRHIGVRELSGLLGYSTFSMVSDVESGQRRVPPGKLICWAKVVGMDPTMACRWWLEENCPDIAALVLVDC